MGKIAIDNIQLIVSGKRVNYKLPGRVIITDPNDNLFPMTTLYELLCQFTNWYPDKIVYKPTCDDYWDKLADHQQLHPYDRDAAPNEICGFLLPLNSIEEVEKEFPFDPIYVSIIAKLAEYFHWESSEW